MEVAEKKVTTKRRSLFARLGDRKMYSAVLLTSRLIFAVCQLSVALDTWSTFKKLSRVPAEGNYDMSLKTLLNYKGDLDWVPKITRKMYMHETYGANRLFNLYLIRLSHYFHRRITSFLLYFAITVFLLLIVLSAFDLFVMFQSKTRRERMRTALVFTRTMLYSALFGVVLSQFIFILYYRTSLCSMETMHPELFVKPTDNTVRLEFLQAGTCKMTQRFSATFLMSFLTLVPDAFLVIVSIIPALRIHSVVNGLKYFVAIFFFISAFLVMDFRSYLAVGTDPYVLDFGIHRFNEEAVASGRAGEAIKLFHQQKSFKMFSVKDSITLQVGRALKDYVKGRSRPVDAKFQVTQELDRTQNLIAHFNYAKQIYAQWDHSSRFYSYFGVYATFLSLVDALSGTVMVIKRHRFLVPLIAILNFIYAFTNIVHCILVQFPFIQARFFCRIKLYTPDEGGIMFETLAISDLMCKIKDVYIICFTLIILLVVLALINVANLYFLRKRK
ncbi:conserved hypothetical protein [Theileria orientalis strain Shintoku]|uniref:Uncharacterized protein n=1 Tax=Theileria orientalis strain Shintoku TaxID=869250 RepID=J4CE50_THEOR|nr:conserved hypothetical protein [Theileria orientalis strain Shintoku]PVC53905.1 hypothetical protein MACL_00003424 [Theileria orientalis]BAM42277.1 conserved hypothetical protein [Theileria orientalis strain Shintoku]|eukprot:XP_009692578.1 conserved hypothetical protein [Theileria orientalis strain Shintoku]